MRHQHRILWALVVALGLGPTLGAQTGTVMPSPKFYGTDENGNPLDGGKLCVYVAGTSTPQDTYSDVDLASIHKNANPVILNGSGLATVFLSPGASYKFVLRAPGSSSLECTTGAIYWTQDNIASTPASSSNFDISGIAGETITAGNAVYLSDGSGGKSAGQWYKADSTNTYSSSAAVQIGMAPSAIASGAVGGIRMAGEVTGLVTSSGTTYFIGTAGAITSTAPTNRRQIAFGNSATSALIAVSPTSISVDGTVRGPLKGYSENWQSVSISAGNLAINYALGNHVQVTLNANITSITVTNLPAAALNVVAPIVIYYIADGTPRTVAHTINTVAARFPGGVAPTMTSTAGKWDTIVYTTFDMAANWFADIASQNR